MTTLVTIAFLLAVTGCFLILQLSPFSFLEGLAAFIKPEKQSMKSRIEQSRKSSQPRGLKLLFLETKEVLRVTGKSGMFSILCVLSMFLFVVGVLMALTMKNTYMVPVLAAGFALLPFYYVKFTAGRHKKQVGTELETALSIMDSADCAIGYEAANMVYKGLIGYRDDYVEHIKNGRCTCTTQQPVP